MSQFSSASAPVPAPDHASELERAGAGTARRIEARLRAQMADGSLPAGALLPSTRALAAELGVSRGTVTAVYEQLAAEGYVQTAPGRRARVVELRPPPPLSPPAPVLAPQRGAGPAEVAPLSAYGRRVAEMPLPALAPPEARPGEVAFLYGAVAAADFPAQAWRRAWQAEQRLAMRPGQRLYYTDPQGDATLRQALQGYLHRARGVVCEPGQILVVNGSQQAIELCARLLLDTGSWFAAEDPGYLMARHCFEATGAQLLPVPVDSQGLCTEHLPQAPGVRLVYVTPSHQFPLGGVLPAARRQALLHWARTQGAWVVEDDYDGEFRYGQRPIDALQTLDGDGRVLYVGTVSKALSPQLRLGYLVLPPALVGVFTQAKRLSDRHAPPLAQRTLARLLASGVYERHVRRLRRANEHRRAALLAAITRHLGPGRARVSGAAAGLHIVLWLPELAATQEPALVAQAQALGVAVYPVAPLFAGPPPARQPAGLVLGYAGLTLAQIETGVARLAQALAAVQAQTR